MTAKYATRCALAAGERVRILAKGSSTYVAYDMFLLPSGEVDAVVEIWGELVSHTFYNTILPGIDEAMMFIEWVYVDGFSVPIYGYA